MKDINVLNFFEENNLNFSSNFKLGVTNLPSNLDFGKEINDIKIDELHANMKFTFSNLKRFVPPTLRNPAQPCATLLYPQTRLHVDTQIHNPYDSHNH